eukprot:COSAG05_NODE_12757_length_456_cov_0.470588_1_plen_120_part_10
MPAPCPFSDPKLCDRIAGPLPEKEVYVYHVGYLGDSREGLHYDWAQITTICIFGHDPWKSSPHGYPQLLCHAHSHGVRVTFGTNTLAQSQYGNTTAVDDAAARAVANFAVHHHDGLNFDI